MVIGRVAPVRRWRRKAAVRRRRWVPKRKINPVRRFNVISKALRGAGMKRFRINNAGTLSSTFTGFIDGNCTQVPIYDPSAAAGTTPTFVHQTRTKDLIYVKGFQLRVALRSQLTQYGAVRLIMLRNTSPTEGLNTTYPYSNVFEGATFQDAQPGSNYNALAVQPINLDLVRSKKDILLDKLITLGEATGDETSTPAVKHLNMWVPFNHVVKYESNGTVTGALRNNKIWTYFLILGAASDALSGGGLGTISYDYYMDCVFTEDA